MKKNLSVKFFSIWAEYSEVAKKKLGGEVFPSERETVYFAAVNSIPTKETALVYMNNICWNAQFDIIDIVEVSQKEFMAAKLDGNVIGPVFTDSWYAFTAEFNYGTEEMCVSAVGNAPTEDDIMKVVNASEGGLCVSVSGIRKVTIAEAVAISDVSEWTYPIDIEEDPSLV